MKIDQSCRHIETVQNQTPTPVTAFNFKVKYKSNVRQHFTKSFENWLQSYRLITLLKLGADNNCSPFTMTMVTGVDDKS